MAAGWKQSSGIIQRYAACGSGIVWDEGQCSFDPMTMTVRIGHAHCLGSILESSVVEEQAATVRKNALHKICVSSNLRWAEVKSEVPLAWLKHVDPLTRDSRAQMHESGTSIYVLLTLGQLRFSILGTLNFLI